MRELHGVMFAGRPYINMKRRALLFDKFQIWRYDRLEGERTEEFEAEISFLKERGLVVAPSLDPNDFAVAGLNSVGPRNQILSADPSYDPAKSFLWAPSGPVFRDIDSRCIADKVRQRSDCDVGTICETDLPPELFGASDNSVMSEVVEVAIEKMPTPDDSCAWEDILDFKEEMRGKHWRFRRFLHSLATKKQSEAEIRDDIDSSLNDYREAMKARRIKIVQSAFAALIVPAVDIAFNPTGNHAGAILAAGLAINKLRVELLEGEMKVPGRECAYVFEAQKRFGEG